MSVAQDEVVSSELPTLRVRRSRRDKKRHRVNFLFAAAVWWTYGAICGVIAALFYITGGTEHVFGHSFFISFVVSTFIGNFCILAESARRT